MLMLPDMLDVVGVASKKGVNYAIHQTIRARTIRQTVKENDMTPLQMAAQECPEMLQNGTCKGRKCVLGGRETCMFFEKCLLPMASWTTDNKRRADFIEAEVLYWRTKASKTAKNAKKSTLK